MAEKRQESDFKQKERGKARLRRANEEVKATERDKARSSMAVRRLNPDVKASERDKSRDRRLDPDVKASERNFSSPVSLHLCSTLLNPVLYAGATLPRPCHCAQP